MSTFTKSPGQTTGLPSWVTAEGTLPPGVIASHSGAPPISLLSGTAEPPTSLLAQLSSALNNGFPSSATGILTGATGLPPDAYPSFGVTGPPAGFTPPSGATGPPPGVTLPPGATGPPAGMSISAGATGPPAGFSIPSGVTGPPGVAMTGFPSGIALAGSSGLPPQATSHTLTYNQLYALIGVTCMLLALCMAAVGGRLMARRVSRMRLEPDDWICVAALVTFIGLCIEQFILAHYGLLILLQFPPTTNVLHIFGKAEFASQLTYAFVTCTAKASLLMLYRRVFSLRVKWFRVAWWTNIGLVAALLTTLIVLNCTQCHPLSTIWNAPASCVPNQTKSSSMGFINAVIDSAILVLPLRMVWSLQMSHKQKIAICGVFGLGLIGVAVSLARAISISNPNLFKGGGLAFILWSTAEPAVALICSCLPVLRPLYTTGIAKLGSSRGFNRYASKRSRSYGYSGGSSNRDREKSNLTGNTFRTTLSTKNKDNKSWRKPTDTEMAGPYEEMQSPISPLDKPLPPAYTPRQEEDTGYHTWSWNLLSRPRNEINAPKLTRSPRARDGAAPWRSSSLQSAGNRTTVTCGKRVGEKSAAPRLKTHTPILDKSLKLTSQFNNWSSPPRTVKTALPQSPSLVQSPKSDADSWASPSLVPTRHFSQRDVLKRPMPVSPNDSFILPSRPRAVARMESNERATPPKLRIRTQSNSPSAPTPPPKLISPHSYADWNGHARDGAVSRAGAQATPRMRSNSDETVWPPTVSSVTREEVEEAIYKGHAM